MSLYYVVLIVFSFITIDLIVCHNSVQERYKDCRENMLQYCNTNVLDIQKCAKASITHYTLFDESIPEYVHRYMINFILPHITAKKDEITSPATFCKTHGEQCLKELSDFPSDDIHKIIRYSLIHKVKNVQKPKHFVDLYLDHVSDQVDVNENKESESFTELYLDDISNKVHLNENYIEIIQVPGPETFCGWYSTSSKEFNSLKYSV